MYSIDYPKYVLASTLDSVNLQLSKHQLELIRKIQAKIQPTLDNSARPLFPEYRPLNRFTYLSVRVIGLWVAYFEGLCLKRLAMFCLYIFESKL